MRIFILVFKHCLGAVKWLVSALIKFLFFGLYFPLLKDWETHLKGFHLQEEWQCFSPVFVRGLIWQHTLTTCSWHWTVLDNNLIFKQHQLYSPGPHTQFNQKTVSLTVILWQKLDIFQACRIESNGCCCCPSQFLGVYNHATIVISDSQRLSFSWSLRVK